MDTSLLWHYIQFSLYFGSVFVAIFYVVKQLPKFPGLNSKLALDYGLHIIVAVFALLICWTFIYLFLAEDLRLYQSRVTDFNWDAYIVESKRFVNCYHAVNTQLSLVELASKILNY